jgi:hypothetical protein
MMRIWTGDGMALSEGIHPSTSMGVSQLSTYRIPLVIDALGMLHLNDNRKPPS